MDFGPKFISDNESWYKNMTPENQNFYAHVLLQTIADELDRSDILIRWSWLDL